MKHVPISRVLFYFTLAWGVAIIWIAPYPPMIDLPQHAAQLALLSDLVTGRSAWIGLVQINLLTPYLIGFALGLPLSFFLPISVVLKILLSVSYLAFVGLFIGLRRRFGADARLDWMFLPGFFGFAYQWGFFTYLVAAPIGLGFVLLVEAFTKHRTTARAFGIVVLGLLLLCSHALVFLFAFAVGAAFMVARTRELRQLWAVAFPFMVLLLVLVAFHIVRGQAEAQFNIPPTIPAINWHFGIRYELLAYSFGWTWQPWALIGSVGMLAVPLLLGLRANLRLTSGWPFLAVTILVLALVPHWAFEAAFVYQRFVLFLFPAYALLFSAPSSTHLTQSRRRLSLLGLPLAMTICFSAYAVHSRTAWLFGQDSKGFEAILTYLDPGQRALSLMFDKGVAGDDSILFVQFPAWYSAERQGFVDPNFAWFPPMIVRFQPTTFPPVNTGFAMHPDWFEWKRDRGDDYRYFIVRHIRPDAQKLFKNAPCAPKQLVQRGNWTVYERGECGARAAKD